MLDFILSFIAWLIKTLFGLFPSYSLLPYPDFFLAIFYNAGAFINSLTNFYIFGVYADVVGTLLVIAFALFVIWAVIALVKWLLLKFD